MTRQLLCLLLVLGTTVMPAGFAWPADEPPPKDSAAEETERKSPQKSEDGTSESTLERERRLLRERLYGATPEERERLSEERKRLSAEAASFGTDPTAIIGYYQLTYQRNAYTNSGRLDAAQAVAQVPITPNSFIRATLPYVWADANQPRGSTQNGTSDTTVRMAGRLYASENVALLVGTDAIFPTAAKNQLGFGKYALGPGGALAFPLPRARSLFFLLVQNFQSIGGDPSRANLNFMQIQPAINTIWSKHWWTSLQGTYYVDWNNNRKTTLNLVGEVGHNFDNHWNVFAGGGAGAMGRDQFLGLDWTVVAGVRWVFRTPLFQERLLESFPRK